MQKISARFSSVSRGLTSISKILMMAMNIGSIKDFFNCYMYRVAAQGLDIKSWFQIKKAPHSVKLLLEASLSNSCRITCLKKFLSKWLSTFEVRKIFI